MNTTCIRILLSGILILGAFDALADTDILYTSYTIVEEKDHSFGNVRSRVTLEIEAPDANADDQKIATMMKAAIDRHRMDWPDAVSVRLWNDYHSEQVIQNRIIYAPDGCGWAGLECNDDLWTDVFSGTIPEDLKDWGRPTEEESEAAEEVICRQDLQCWGEKHLTVVEVHCPELIEDFARYDHDWTDSWLEYKFSKWRWDDRATGSLAYYGDKVKFQNGFGAWQKMTYWCFLDVQGQTVRAQVHEP